MTQKDAVFSAVSQILADNNVQFTPSVTNVASVLTRELRSQINTALAANFSSGLVELSEDAKSKLNNAAELRAYVSGLVSNWVKKDSRLNGGAILASTSSFTNSASNKVLKADPQLQALRKLHKAQIEPSKRLEIQAHIDRRIKELNT